MKHIFIDVDTGEILPYLKYKRGQYRQIKVYMKTNEMWHVVQENKNKQLSLW